MLRVLVIDDQPAVRDALEVLFDVHDIPCVTAAEPDEAISWVRQGGIGVVIQDMNFKPGRTGGEEGVRLFRRLREIDPEMPILLMTAWTSLETAVSLVKEGASDYLAKPWDDRQLVDNVRQLLESRGHPPETSAEGPGIASRPDTGLVVESAAMRQVVDLALQVAPSEVPILITGPNGAGKEKIADLLHAGSTRRDGPLVKVNVGALPVDLMEAELFGAEAGAYTGLERRRLGRFETADGGTLFLDEIDSLSLAGQVKLLRVLERHEFQRLGSSETRRADVRVVSASNADLRQAIDDGRLREDLYFRLNVVEIRVPPLAERPDDVLPLAECFLEEHGGDKRLSAESRRALLAYDWPGNVRELRNRVQRACLVSPGSEIRPEDLDLTSEAFPASPADGPDLDPDQLVERRRIERALVSADGIVARAADELGISRQALYRRMSRLGIVVEKRLR